MKKFAFYFLTVLIVVFARLPEAQSQNFGHETWTALLQKHVSSTGNVDYAGIKANTAQLDTYLQKLSKGIPPTASKAEKKAFWINAYNAFTVKLILDNYPVKSIRDLKDGKPWSYKFIQIAGQMYSLDNVEHDILRKKFFDARLHFVLVCAAKSCPKLLNEAYISSKLNAQLDAQAKSFINHPKKNQLSAGNIQLSMLFDWYKEDFLKTKDIRSIQAYLNQYSQLKINADALVKYLHYDWSLNE